MNKKMTRQEANRKILEKIALIVEREPDWRFHQILQNMNIEHPNQDNWYTESAETLKYIANH